MKSLERRLLALDSPLAISKVATDQLRHQAGSVLDDVEAGAGHAPATQPGAARLTEEIGASRAYHGVHPVESLRAAAVMFEVLLPVVLKELRARGSGEVALLTAANTLNSSIMRRVGLGAVSYASFLLKKVNSSHQDERHRIARELHDRAAHAVGVALQELELHDLYLDRDPHQASAKIISAREVLHEALDVVRQVAKDLHESAVELGGLEKALAGYLASRVPFGVDATVSITGDVVDLPSEVCEELYIVLREAVRNALTHSAAKTIEVSIDVHGPELCATVRDDGRGFDVAGELASPAGVGLLSMRERVELLDGSLAINSAAGKGTTVWIGISQIAPAS